MDSTPTLNLKFELETARRIVGELADLIRPACDRLEIVGSIRRGTPYVKDADVVAIPVDNSADKLHTILDNLVESGTAQKALYGESQTTRWGSKARGLIFQGLQIEIDLTTEISWGYKKWLRSGPGEANAFIMSYLIYKHAALRFIDGDGWYSPSNAWAKVKDKWAAADKQQLNIPDEEALFNLLGMPCLPPGQRSEQRYKTLMKWNSKHRFPDYAPFVVKKPVQVQLPMFGDALIERENRHLKEGRASNRINFLVVNPSNASVWAAQTYREAIAKTERQLGYFRFMGGTYPSYARRAQVLEGELAMFRKLTGLETGLQPVKSL